MKNASSLVAYGAPLLVYCALIFSISALTAPPAPEYPFEWGDKINHALAYALMCFFAVRATRLLSDRPLRKRLFPAVIFCIAYGGTDELHQLFVPGRACDIGDWIADAVGASAAAWVIPLLVQWKPIAILVADRSRLKDVPPRTA